MKRVLKVLGITVGVVVVVLIAGYIYLISAFPKVDPPPNVKVESNPQLIARGEYLANHVTVCMDCHSKRDWTKYSAPIKPGTFGSGGDVWDENVGLPGRVSMKNITPAAIGNWTDGEIIRAITCGVNKDNQALFPIMPYTNYNNLTTEDLYSIVSYIRTLKPIENKVPETELNFPLNLIVKTMPIRSHNPMSFDKNNPTEFGKYLITIAGCKDCHSKSEKGEPITGMEFGGGEEFPLPGGIVRSMNLTPDNETGIGQWTKEVFINRFKYYDNDNAKVVSVSEHDFNTPMPWTMYASMTEEDLGSIFDYLKTLKPIKNKVERFSPNQTAMK